MAASSPSHRNLTFESVMQTTRTLEQWRELLNQWDREDKPVQPVRKLRLLGQLEACNRLEVLAMDQYRRVLLSPVSNPPKECQEVVNSLLSRLRKP